MHSCFIYFINSDKNNFKQAAEGRDSTVSRQSRQSRQSRNSRHSRHSMVYPPDPPDAEGRPSILTGVAGKLLLILLLLM